MSNPVIAGRRAIPGKNYFYLFTQNDNPARAGVPGIRIFEGKFLSQNTLLMSLSRVFQRGANPAIHVRGMSLVYPGSQREVSQRGANPALPVRGLSLVYPGSQNMDL
jgi:hypothetical protein